MPEALVCPQCHSGLNRNIDALSCNHCGAVYRIAPFGIADFAPDAHYDRFTGSEVLGDEHRRGLELEVEGSRRRILDFYMPLLGARGTRVLDCGCGNGVSVETLIANGYDAWGNDLSELRAWQWRERSVRDRLVVADALHLPFPAGFFDSVISSGVIEHIGVEEIAVPRYAVRPLPGRDELRHAYLRELQRVVKPEGQIFINCPNGAFPVDFWHGRRLHSTREGFLPKLAEIRALAAPSRVEAISPYRRLQFRQTGGRLAGLGNFFFKVMTFRGLRFLAGTALNPFLVVRIRNA